MLTVIVGAIAIAAARSSRIVRVPSATAAATAAA